MRGMKTARVLPFVVLAMTLRLFAAPMSDDDREHLLVHFQMTGQMLAEQVRGLSPAQLEYKASAGSMEHSGMRFASGGRRDRTIGAI